MVQVVQGILVFCDMFVIINLRTFNIMVFKSLVDLWINGKEATGNRKIGFISATPFGHWVGKTRRKTKT